MNEALQTIRAAVQRHRGGTLTVERVRLRAPGPGEVEVRVAATGVCHSDVSYADGHWPAVLPAVWGHEVAGVVAATGDGVEGLSVGDRVVVTLIRSCGRCQMCERGLEVACTARFALDRASPLSDGNGHPIIQGVRTAGFAERTVVHVSQAVPIGDGIPLELAALLACSVLTGVGAVTTTAGVEPGSVVVIIGGGGVGLSALQAARRAGARAVLVVEPNEEKRKAAHRFGATHDIDPSVADRVENVAALTEGAMADYVFLTTGAASALDGVFDLLAAGGTLVLVGMPADGVTMRLDPSRVAGANLRILGSKMGTARPHRDIPLLVDQYGSGDLDLSGLVSGRFPLDEINEAVDGVRRGEAIRNVIVFEGGQG